MVEMGELLKSNKPQHVYNKLTSKYDELSGPAYCMQVYDKKKRDVTNKRKENGHDYNQNNFADHINEIENRVSANDPFIGSIVRLNSKLPCIILYTDEQIKVSKVAKIRNRYNQVPHLTQDTNGKVTNSQKTPQTRAKRPAPPPSRRPRSTHKQTRTKHSKHKTEQNKNRSSH